MKIRGSLNSSCKSCGYMFQDTEKGTFTCMLTNSEKSLSDTCKKYVYDIYKHEPKKKADFGKFKKEDFEI